MSRWHFVFLQLLQKVESPVQHASKDTRMQGGPGQGGEGAGEKQGGSMFITQRAQVSPFALPMQILWYGLTLATLPRYQGRKCKRR
jgi:hypothetical protein